MMDVAVFTFFLLLFFLPQLRQKADNIYHRFLSPEATMPVNLEGDYRQMVEKAIKNPSPEMFREHQLQVS